MLEIIFESCWFWIEIASIGLAIVSYILIIVQSSNNYMFKHYKTRSLIAERLLYEQFSYEVYKSINSFSFSSSSSDDYDTNKEIYAEANFDSYYDCRDIYDQELNEEICQNQIVKNNTCCKSECCLKTNGDETFCNNYIFNLNDESNKESIKNNRILYYNEEEYFDDPKRRFCSYYNKYYTDKDISKYFLCKCDYEELYLNKCPNMCIGKEACAANLNIDCGIIDTMNNHLYVESGSYCPINEMYYDGKSLSYSSNYKYVDNSHKIITRIIFSETIPDIHEWKGHFVSLVNFENKESEEYKNLKEKILNINKKDFENLLNDNLKIYTESDGYVDVSYFSDFNFLHPKAKIKIYTTNYIGFGSKSDLESFIYNFDRSDPTNNPLYKIGKKVYPSLEAIICGSVLLVLCIIYLIFFWLKSIKDYLWLFIVKDCVLGATFLILLGVYIWQLVIFKKINIDMDKNFNKILSLYNNRRMQYCLLFSLIFLFLSIIPFLIFLIIKLFEKCKDKSNQPQEVQASQTIPQSNTNENLHFPNSASQYQTIEENQTNTHRSPQQDIGNSENHLINDNNDGEYRREGNGVDIHTVRNQTK